MDHLPSIAALERTRDTLEVPLGRRLDVVEREAVEASRNPTQRAPSRRSTCVARVTGETKRSVLCCR